MTRTMSNSSTGGEFGLNSPLTFGKYKGQTIEDIYQADPKQTRSYLAWMTHALTAEEFLVNFNTQAITSIQGMCRNMKIYVKGAIVPYQMANYYLQKIGEATVPFTPLVDDAVSLAKAREQIVQEKHDKQVSQSIKQFHSLLKELDNGN